VPLLKIVFTIPTLGGGGAERVVSIMANYWAGHGRQITILTYEDGSKPPAYDLHPSIKVVPLNIQGRISGLISAAAVNLNRIYRIRQALIKEKPDCVIAFAGNNNVRTILAAQGLGLPVIVSERNDPDRAHVASISRMSWSLGLAKLIRRLTYPLSSCIVTQTVQSRDRLETVLQAKTEVIHNPVLRSRDYGEEQQLSVTIQSCGAGFPACLSKTCSSGRLESLPHGCIQDSPASTEWSQLSLSSGKKVLSIGRLDRQKRHDLLLEAFSLVAQKHDCSLIILGEGPLRGWLEAMVEDMGLSQRVTMPGWVANPWRAAGQCDLFVLTSEYEGFPNALVEAMAYGIAVISFDCPTGPREIIRDGVDGVLVPPLDVEKLAEVMDRLLGDEAERRRLGRRAYEVLERFGIEATMALWEVTLERACSRSRSVRRLTKLREDHGN